ncbi:heme-binding protein 1-like [Tachypleus tridentatus]|uniref:heme-binding protein 1-like n=1 Tax=Tachypleus tridentatus TaxID=6853 RepID=UPI003FD540A5
MSFLKFIKSAVTGSEEPKYEVVKKTDDFEIRSYPETQWVTLKLSGKLPDEFGREEFHRLFGYINGQNESGASMDMTAPVLFQVSTEEGKERDYTVSFFLSSSLNDPPKPIDPDMYLVKSPSREVFVRTFGGFAKDADWKKEFESLKSKLENPAEADLLSFCRAGFDPPFKPFGRRNEVWVFKKQMSVSDVAE